MIADIGIRCESVAAVRARWQEYRGLHGTQPVERIGVVDLLEHVDDYRSPVGFRGRVVELRALVDALVEAVDLLERVPAGEDVAAIVANPRTSVDTDSVDPVDL